MLPVFPLNIVVLPSETVALHLFEPRYKQLYKDCKNGEEFVIVYSDKDGIADFGTIVVIDEVINEFPDETVDVIVKGVDIIKVKKIHKLFPGKLYSGVVAEKNSIDTIASEKLIEQFKIYLEKFGKSVKKKPPLSAYYIANRLKLPVETKLEIISIENSDKLSLYLINELRFQQNVREQEAQLNYKFHLN